MLESLRIGKHELSGSYNEERVLQDNVGEKKIKVKKEAFIKRRSEAGEFQGKTRASLGDAM